MKHLKITLSALLLTTVIWSCRKEKGVIPEEQTQLPGQITAVYGLYLLNEGGWTHNNASLDYYDYAGGIYRKNIYGQINPSTTLGLGDTGNDIQIYGSKLYIVVNNSNKVEVLDVKTAKKIKQIDIPNCRYITFYKEKAYVTSYDGYVALIDTTALVVGSKINVGQQPEEMAVVGTKLYVANSGGYNSPNYERTISVIDLNTNLETKRIDVDINLHRLKADQYGDIYVISRGHYDYNDRNKSISSNLYVIDTKTDAVKKNFKIPATSLTINGDEAFVFSYDYSTYKSNYIKLNVKDEIIISGNFITDGTETKIVTPYGLAVDPISADIYVTDAKDYSSQGTLYCFDKNGKNKFSVTTGYLPGHMVFYTK